MELERKRRERERDEARRNAIAEPVKLQSRDKNSIDERKIET